MFAETHHGASLLQNSVVFRDDLPGKIFFPELNALPFLAVR
ncbi:hypothetical protein [Fortiea sp. LEGE XX443]|nr:hypothetical protein [Fortiea sp. LEGE XX443]